VAVEALVRSPLEVVVGLQVEVLILVVVVVCLAGPGAVQVMAVQVLL
jgi:hypothetical protein